MGASHPHKQQATTKIKTLLFAFSWLEVVPLLNLWREKALVAAIFLLMEGKGSGYRHFLPSSRRESPECGGNGECHGTSCACVPPRSHPAYLRSIAMSQRTPPHGHRRSQHTSIHSSCYSWRRPSTSSALWRSSNTHNKCR